MPYSKSLIFIFLTIIVTFPAYAQRRAQIFSPTVADKFNDVAYEITNTYDSDPKQARQAIVFLMSALELDKRATYVFPEIIKTCSKYSLKSRHIMVFNVLSSYIDNEADLQVIRQGLSFLLDMQNSREEREDLLISMLQNLSGKNNALDSELLTMLGLLQAEKADTQTAAKYFANAYNANKYNQLAFEKLTELVPEQIAPDLYLERLRLAISENPLNLDSAIDFASYAERLQLYDSASAGFEYCANLFSYLHPDSPLPAQIYLRLAMTSYNTDRNVHRGIQLAKDMRQKGVFDCILEGIAARAALKTDDNTELSSIVTSVERKEDQLLSADSQDIDTQLAGQIAWFYCFAMPNADKALSWANKAYAGDPDTGFNSSVLAYALVMNENDELAQPLVESKDISDQIAAVTLAQIQLKNGQNEKAFELLKNTIDFEPATLESHYAREILAQNNQQYISPIDSTAIEQTLEKQYGEAFIPVFKPVENIIKVELNIPGNKFSYNSTFSGSLSITNKSAEYLIISKNGLFKGQVRVDAVVSGDIEQSFNNHISLTTIPSKPLMPERSIIIPLDLFSGELKKLLLNHPQANLDIEFTVYIDPVTAADGSVINSTSYVAPIKTVIKRPGINITEKYLQNRLNAASRGKQGQKIDTAQLFAGLIAEEQSLLRGEVKYRMVNAKGMSSLLKSALIQNLEDYDWIVQVETLCSIMDLPVDYEFMNAISANLNSDKWPVRMTALYILANNQGAGFDRVLDWTVKYDPDFMVQEMAVALGAIRPEVQQPAGEPNMPSNTPNQP